MMKMKQIQAEVTPDLTSVTEAVGLMLSVSSNSWWNILKRALSSLLLLVQLNLLL